MNRFRENSRWRFMKIFPLPPVETTNVCKTLERSRIYKTPLHSSEESVVSISSTLWYRGIISAIQVESYSSTQECFNPLLVSHGSETPPGGRCMQAQPPCRRPVVHHCSIRDTEEVWGHDWFNIWFLKLFNYCYTVNTCQSKSSTCLPLYC